MQRTLEEAFWDGVPGLPGPSWGKGLQRYLRHYNRQRPHAALHYQTHRAYAQERLAQTGLSLP